MIATIPFLKSRFKAFNHACFADSLAPVPLRLSRAVRSLGACTYKKRRLLFGKVEYYDFCIRISTQYDLPESALEDILLHEMIHYEILSKQQQDSSAHGRLFRARMKAINEQFGRHIAITHRGALQRMSAATQKPVWRVVARVRLNDGRIGIKVLPRIAQRLKAYRSGLLHSREVAVVEFFWSDDPYFARFPKSSALNLFFPADPDFDQHLATARPIDL